MAGGNNFGPQPSLKWVDVADIISNAAYQRSVEGQKSKRIIASIGRDFRWPLCNAIVVCANGAGKFYVIDGQHRVEGARLAGARQLPALVFPKMSVEQQAEIFVNCNSERVAMSTMQLYYARLAAGAKDARQVASLLKETGLTIPRYPKQARQLEAGETMAVKLFFRLINNYERQFLVVALKAVAAGVANKPGEATASLITGACLALTVVPGDAAVYHLRTFIHGLAPLEIEKMATTLMAQTIKSHQEAITDILTSAAKGAPMKRAPMKRAVSPAQAKAPLPALTPALRSLINHFKGKGDELTGLNQALTAFKLNGRRVTREDLTGIAKRQGWKAPE